MLIEELKIIRPKEGITRRQHVCGRTKDKQTKGGKKIQRKCKKKSLIAPILIRRLRR